MNYDNHIRKPVRLHTHSCKTKLSRARFRQPQERPSLRKQTRSPSNASHPHLTVETQTATAEQTPRTRHPTASWRKSNKHLTEAFIKQKKKTDTSCNYNVRQHGSAEQPPITRYTWQCQARAQHDTNAEKAKAPRQQPEHARKPCVPYITPVQTSTQLTYHFSHRITSEDPNARSTNAPRTPGIGSDCGSNSTTSKLAQGRSSLTEANGMFTGACCVVRHRRCVVSTLCCVASALCHVMSELYRVVLALCRMASVL